MPNKRKEVVLSSIKEVLKLILVGGIIFSCSEKVIKQETEYGQEELSIFKRALLYLENSEFENAFKLYSYFIQKYPNHPLTDDAAYRLSYIYIIDSVKNPFLNYEKPR